MGRKKVGGFIFETSESDHPPDHVHILDGQNRKVGRWDIEHQCPMKGDSFPITRRLREALRQAGYWREVP